jgi:hypothetical protein
MAGLRGAPVAVVTSGWGTEPGGRTVEHKVERVDVVALAKEQRSVGQEDAPALLDEQAQILGGDDVGDETLLIEAQLQEDGGALLWERDPRVCRLALE